MEYQIEANKKHVGFWFEMKSNKAINKHTCHMFNSEFWYKHKIPLSFGLSYRAFMINWPYSTSFIEAQNTVDDIISLGDSGCFILCAGCFVIMYNFFFVGNGELDSEKNAFYCYVQIAFCVRLVIAQRHSIPKKHTYRPTCVYGEREKWEKKCVKQTIVFIVRRFLTRF